MNEPWCNVQVNRWKYFSPQYDLEARTFFGTSAVASEIPLTMSMHQIFAHRAPSSRGAAPLTPPDLKRSQIIRLLRNGSAFAEGFVSTESCANCFNFHSDNLNLTEQFGSGNFSLHGIQLARKFLMHFFLRTCTFWKKVCWIRCRKCNGGENEAP